MIVAVGVGPNGGCDFKANSGVGNEINQATRSKAEDWARMYLQNHPNCAKVYFFELIAEAVRESPPISIRELRDLPYENKQF